LTRSPIFTAVIFVVFLPPENAAFEKNVQEGGQCTGSRGSAKAALHRLKWGS
jgi:hypothetical protein